MTTIRIDGTFDMDAVAARFPGLLTFRGAYADQPGITEVEGDVDMDALLEAIGDAEVVVEATVPEIGPFRPQRYRWVSRITSLAGWLLLADQLVRRFS